ncbi:hypothetical protein [Tropicibacter naphthalenivorans]|uniref:Uncharacterized protein n=1 Tax=Tropicibacter naphthalenivorans TaxID=441103 RepID=A0A0N7LZY2_9RHOB|nr:hypothetical protein [Tropicibacter naphthalenivorans]CUH78937.1 hypothetical protein TRN7648_02246 [Tropicibacter naphthalenivorans]SMD10463.1 hypothetical protein SAMN04488093_12221 [Tropicibacter naphthalenivorans]
MLRQFLILSFYAAGSVFAQAEEIALDVMPSREVLDLLVDAQDELKLRGVSRSGNSLTGDLGEFMFINAFGWTAAKRSQKGFDALDGPTRIQIKARRLSAAGGNEQLGAIRDLEGFDLLAAVIFDRRYHVLHASIIPAGVIREFADFNAHTNSYRFFYNDAVRMRADVLDVSEALRSLEF